MINSKETGVIKQVPKETDFHSITSRVSNNDKARQLQCVKDRPDFLNRPMEIVTHLAHTADHRNRNAPYSSHQGCKMPSRMMHKCAYGSDGKITLESLADAVCFLSSKLSTFATKFVCIKVSFFCYFLYLKILSNFLSLLILHTTYSSEKYFE